MIIRNLEQSILFTICLFDVFEYPLTSFEVWKFLFGYKTTLDRVLEQLDELIRQGKIEMKNGFYFLPERSNLVDEREEKYNISEKYWNKAIFAAKILSYIPFIKMVAVFNSLSFFNCKKSSDIDFFIVTKKNKIWTARAASAFLLQFLGLRRWGRNHSGKICLSYYVSEEFMNLSATNRKGFEFFIAFWVSSFAPILSREKTFSNFWDKNSWVLKYFPNIAPNITNYYINFREPFLAGFIRRTAEKIFGFSLFENIFKKIQTKMMDRKQRKIGSPDSVIYNNCMLKFHTETLPPQSNKSLIYYKKELQKRLNKRGF